MGSKKLKFDKIIVNVIKKIIIGSQDALGKLLRTQEAREARGDSSTSFVPSNLA